MLVSSHSRKQKAVSIFALLLAFFSAVSLFAPQQAAAAQPGKLQPGHGQVKILKSNAQAVSANSGDSDLTFGHSGKLNINFGGSPDEVYGSALQPDGKIVLVGDGYTSANDGISGFALARLTTAGLLDSTFGNGGRVRTNFVAGQNAGARAVQLLPNGQILVAGYAYNSSYYHNTFALARYNANGTLDTTFGTNGVTYTPIEQGTGGNGPEDMVTAMALDANNNIVVVGYTGFIFMNFAAARFTPAGVLDTTFANKGIFTKSVGGDSRGAALAIQPDGKIIIAGSAYGPNSPAEDFAMVRLLKTGAIDTTFGAAGVVTTDFIGGSDYASGVALLPNGKIILTGSGQLYAPQPYERWGTALAQYNANGSLDTTWGYSGLQLWSWGSDLSSTWGSGLVRPEDGRLVTTGVYLNDSIIVNIYKADGTPDESFAGTGSVSVDFSSAKDSGNTVLVQPDGNIVAAGRAVPDGNQALTADFGVVRVIGTGPLGGPTATATKTATRTATAVRTNTSVALTSTPTKTATRTATRTATASATRTVAATGTATKTATRTATAVVTNTATRTATATATRTATPTGPTCPAMAWTSLTGVSASGDKITKTLASDGWNAGAVSARTINSGDGSVQMTVDSTNNYLIFGLGSGNTDASYTDVDFGFYLSGIGQQMQVWESGLYRATLPGIYQVGDVLKVAVAGGKVNYYRNSTLLYTSTLTPAYPLRLDSSIYTQGAAIGKAQLCGTNLSN